MKKEELQAFGESFAKNIKTEQDLNEFRQMLTKITVEAVLNGELEEHLCIYLSFSRKNAAFIPMTKTIARIQSVKELCLKA